MEGFDKHWLNWTEGQYPWCTGAGLLTKSCPTFVTPWTAACQAPLSMTFSTHGALGIVINEYNNLCPLKFFGCM